MKRASISFQRLEPPLTNNADASLTMNRDGGSFRELSRSVPRFRLRGLAPASDLDSGELALISRWTSLPRVRYSSCASQLLLTRGQLLRTLGSSCGSFITMPSQRLVSTERHSWPPAGRNLSFGTSKNKNFSHFRK